MIKAILGIGIPGAGKTTVIKSFAKKYDYAYVSPDDIREELTGNPADQSKNREVWEEAKRRAKLFLDRGTTVVIDATFANQDQRRDFVKFARVSGAEKIQGVFVDSPLEIAKERNLSRQTRNVPEHVLDRMNGMLGLNPPNIADGFDSVFTLDENQTIKNVETKHEGSTGIDTKA